MGTPEIQTAIKPPSSRSSKRDAVLAVGAASINDLGAGAVRLNKIAEIFDLSRNSLYYYVKDRSDLVYQCYLSTCDVILRDIDEAEAVSPNADRQIEHFIQLSLDPERPERAIVSDHDMLKKPLRADIAKRIDFIIQRIANMIEQGQTQGVLRLCDAEMAAQMLLGMINWSFLWFRWISTSDVQRSRYLVRAAKVIKQSFLGGLDKGNNLATYLNDATALAEQIDRDDLGESRRSIDTRRQIIDAASLLFNRRGLHGTSLVEIGQHVGVTKGAVYHHFKDKLELIHACYEAGFERYSEILDVVVSSEQSGLGKMISNFYLNCEVQVGETPPMIFQPGLGSLPDQFRVSAQRLKRRSRKVHKQALDDGSLEAVDSLIVETPAGAHFWIQKWLPSRKGINQETVATQMTTLLLCGLKAN